MSLMIPQCLRFAYPPCIARLLKETTLHTEQSTNQAAHPSTQLPPNQPTSPSTAPAATRAANHSANVPPPGAAKSRIASELLISAVLKLISQHGALNAADTEAVAHSAATIEQHLKTLAALPDMEPILRATCLQLSEQWGMLLEQQRPKPAPSAFPSAFMTRLISGPRQTRTN
jgi:hypothetical protein